MKKIMLVFKLIIGFFGTAYAFDPGQFHQVEKFTIKPEDTIMLDFNGIAIKIERGTEGEIRIENEPFVSPAGFKVLSDNNGRFSIDGSKWKAATNFQGIPFLHVFIPTNVKIHITNSYGVRAYSGLIELLLATHQAEIRGATILDNALISSDSIIIRDSLLPAKFRMNGRLIIIRDTVFIASSIDIDGPPGLSLSIRHSSGEYLELLFPDIEFQKHLFYKLEVNNLVILEPGGLVKGQISVKKSKIDQIDNFSTLEIY